MPRCSTLGGRFVRGAGVTLVDLIAAVTTVAVQQLWFSVARGWGVQAVQNSLKTLSGEDAALL